MVRPMSGMHALAERMQQMLEAAGAAARGVTAPASQVDDPRRAGRRRRGAGRDRGRRLARGLSRHRPGGDRPADRVAAGADRRATRGHGRRRQRDPRRRDRRRGVRAGAATGRSRDRGAAPREGEIVALYVHPGHWRGGVGRALVEAALDALAAAGYAEAIVWTLAESPRNLAFYEALGFAATAGPSGGRASAARSRSASGSRSPAAGRRRPVGSAPASTTGGSRHRWRSPR